MTTGESTVPTKSHLVLDSGPLLAAHIPYGPDTVYYTVPSVLSEIRDAASKARIATLPFPICIREPTGESFRAVWDFAKGVTGDLAALSRTDMLVCALALDLAKEHDGYTDAPEASANVAVHEGKPKKGVVKEAAGEQVCSDDSGEWITPENVAQKKQKDLLKVQAQPTLSTNVQSAVSCMTSDFAMQNVLLQMRLSVTSVGDGKRIRQLKSWMLRCHACCWYTADMSRRFCDKCGGPTLMRTSYVLDAEGKAHFFLARNFRYNLRGTRYDMPMPKGGRAPDLITREDQKEFIRAVKTQHRSEAKELKAMLASSSATQDDLDERLAGIFGTMEIASEMLKKKHSSSSAAPRVAIGAGRRNPNEVKHQRN